MKAISLCLWRRPEYTRKVLESIRVQPGGSDYTLFIGIDGEGPDPVAAIADSIKFAPKQIVRHRSHVGCNQNTKLTLARAFEKSDYVIHLEDDTPLGLDALKYFEWAQQFGTDRSLFTVGAWGIIPKLASKPQDNEVAIRRSHFSVWAWATWKDRWLEMERDWTTESDTKLSWDYQVDKVRAGRFQIQPIVSRSNNIGSDLGTHRGDYLLAEWAGSKDFKIPTTYRLDTER